MSPSSRLLAAVAVLVVAPAAIAQPKEHPLIKGYPGAEVGTREDFAYEEFEFPAGPTKDGKFTRGERAAGRTTQLNYDDPPGRSPVEKAKNYLDAFKKAGFKTLFTCKGEECGSQVGYKWLGYIPYNDQARYWLGRLERRSGDLTVGMHVEVNGTRFVIVEAKPMETGLVTVSADELKKGIESDGHSAVYGLLFDTGKSDLKPQSDPILEQIVKLLKDDASLKLLVVGHTDSVGDFDQNLGLSQRRAQAVMRALVTRHKVEARRLKAGGVGSQVPVASNRNEEGRARNRRVDLVELP